MPSRRFRHLTALVTVLVFLFSAVCPSAVIASGGEILFLDESEDPETSDNNNPDTEEIPSDEPSNLIPGEIPVPEKSCFCRTTPLTVRKARTYRRILPKIRKIRMTPLKSPCCRMIRQMS